MGEKGSGPAIIITVYRQAIAVAVGELNWMNECCTNASWVPPGVPGPSALLSNCTANQPKLYIKTKKKTKKNKESWNHSSGGSHKHTHMPACTVEMGVGTLHAEWCIPPLSAGLTACHQDAHCYSEVEVWVEGLRGVNSSEQHCSSGPWEKCSIPE